MSDPTNERIAALESNHDALSREIRGMADSVGRSLTEVKDAINGIVQRVNAQSRTNWSVLASWAAVVITMVGLFAQGPLRDVQRIDDAGNKLRDELAGKRERDAFKDGETAARLADMQRRIELIESRRAADVK